MRGRGAWRLPDVIANFALPHPQSIAACSCPAPKRARTECGCKCRVSLVVSEAGPTLQSYCPLISSRLDKAQFRSAMTDAQRPAAEKSPAEAGLRAKGLPRRWLPTTKASLVAAVTQPDSDTYPAVGPLRRRPRCLPSAKGAYGESGGG